MWRLKVFSVFLILFATFVGSALQAQESMELPTDVRSWFRNPDGSCVQCSIGMCGTWNNVPEATTLLWNTEYGKAS